MLQKMSGYGICTMVAGLVGGCGAIATLACTQVPPSVPPSQSAPESTPESTPESASASAATLGETSLPGISERELSLGGIFPGDDEATVIGKLGQPNNIAEDFGDRTFEYTDFTVVFYAGRVLEVVSANSSYCTPSGICPTMAFERARARYGTPTVTEREDGQYMEYYPPEPGTCWLKIAVDDDHNIDVMTVECQL
ncbi:hypothetical protein [Nodosilinea sp. AN01ver1]|uniref:hypothetical protein n=1 Tax=Nodosilinea sp. AN01ver1 TaxID=3423362 RepID=UPI003D31B9B7